MRYSKKDLEHVDREALIRIIGDLQLKVKKKNSELLNARTKLSAARSRVMKLKDVLAFQRQRILELHT